MREFAALAEAIHERGTHTEELRDLAHGKEHAMRTRGEKVL